MLSKEQIKFILYIYNLDWIDADSEDSEEEETRKFNELLLKVDSAEFHYYLCSVFSWANGVECIKALVDHPCCDYGTALMVYWYAEPASLIKFRNEDIKEGNPKPLFNEKCKLLEYIEKKLAQDDFPSKLISVNPRSINDYECDLALSRPKLVSTFMLKESPGKRLPDLEDLSEYKN